MSNRKLLRFPKHKKKGNESQKPVQNTVEIPSYAPNQGLAPTDYEICEDFLFFEKGFEEFCWKILDTGCCDRYTDSYVDDVIDMQAEVAVASILSQRAEHVAKIEKALNALHKGDAIKIESKLESYKKEKVINDKNLEKFKRVYYAGTSLEREE